MIGQTITYYKITSKLGESANHSYASVSKFECGGPDWRMMLSKFSRRSVP